MIPDPDIAIGARVRSLREQRHVTQAGLAGRIGVTFQQVQKYEKGTNRIAASRLQAIAQVLDVPASILLGETPDASDAVAAMAATPSGRDMAAAWSLLSPPLQTAVLRLAQAAGPMVVIGGDDQIAIDFDAIRGNA